MKIKYWVLHGLHKNEEICIPHHIPKLRGLVPTTNLLPLERLYKAAQEPGSSEAAGNTMVLT